MSQTATLSVGTHEHVNTLAVSHMIDEEIGNKGRFDKSMR